MSNKFNFDLFLTFRTNNKFFGRENVTVDYTVIYNEDKDVGTMVDEIVNAILKLEAGSTLLLDEKKIHAQGSKLLLEHSYEIPCLTLLKKTPIIRACI